MTRPSLRWTIISSAEQRSGRYAIINDPHDPEVRVMIDGQHLAHGFDSVAEAKDYCLKHHLGVTADRNMVASARHMTPIDLED